MLNLPRMTLVKQSFDTSGLHTVHEIKQSIMSQCVSLHIEKQIKPGQSIAITAGSRGITNISGILKTLCDYFKELGANPWIVPAMGSHGGATAEGQAALLAKKGILEQSIGAPIRSSMDVVSLGTGKKGFPVYIDALASKADHIVVVNRVKPHTKFEGPLQSGLFKMMVVGLGKHKGAEVAHQAALSDGFPTVLSTAGNVILNHCPILFGLAIVENSYHQVHSLKILLPRQIESEEKKLLRLASDLVPKIPLNDIDLLIVDQIGKDISGSGMDTKVIGRDREILGTLIKSPRIKRIFVRDLSQGSDGNGFGIGLADFTTNRLIKAINLSKTYVNAQTAMSPEKAALPMYFESDAAAITEAFNSIGNPSPQITKLVRIRDTLNLEFLYVSESLVGELPRSACIVGEPQKIEFDDCDNLLNF